jgi:hypothetical protein
MASAFQMQIVELATGHVVHRWAPGLAVETELLDNLCRRVQAKGVGLGRTEAHVIADVRAALEELIYDLKTQV